MEMAKSAVSQRERFPRTLVFVAFAGEERGLLGSAHYAATPAISMDNTIGMINLDMVGRANGSVDLAGWIWRPDGGDLRRVSGQGEQVKIRSEGPGAAASDIRPRSATSAAAINCLPGSTQITTSRAKTGKNRARGVSRVAALALEFAARLAERNDRPEFIAPKR